MKGQVSKMAKKRKKKKGSKMTRRWISKANAFYRMIAHTKPHVIQTMIDNIYKYKNQGYMRLYVYVDHFGDITEISLRFLGYVMYLVEEIGGELLDEEWEFMDKEEAMEKYGPFEIPVPRNTKIAILRYRLPN